jgi:hypothetical protein
MATYRYGVVRSRIAASQLVAGTGKRFESARRLSTTCQTEGARDWQHTAIPVPCGSGCDLDDPLRPVPD